MGAACRTRNWFGMKTSIRRVNIFLFALGALVKAFQEAVKRSVKFSEAVDKFMLKAPVVGDIVFNSVIARFSRTLATTFAAGVPLVEALDSVAGAAGNSVYSKAIKNIRDDVTTGAPLYDSILSTGIFPSMLMQMVSIGEESGALDEMLGKVADFYEDAVDNAVDSLSSLMEPIIMSWIEARWLASCPTVRRTKASAPS